MHRAGEQPTHQYRLGNRYGFFHQQPVGRGRTLRTHYLLHLQQLAAISNPERREQLVGRIVTAYRQRKTASGYSDDGYTQLVFTLVQESQLFHQYHAVFAPVRYSNTYNEQLIKGLIAIEQFDTAERYCRQQITGNVRNEYNIAYLQLLKTIYALQHKQSLLLNTLAELLPLTFDFADYQYIYEHTPEGDAQKTWHTKLMTKVKTAMSGRNSRLAAAFCMQVFRARNTPSKMIDCLHSESIPHRLILEYFDEMAAADKDKLLEALIRKGRYGMWGLYHESEDDTFPLLLAKVAEHFTHTQLLAAMAQEEKHHIYHVQHGFWAYVKKQLKGGA
jgi:hypothetical protein